jgi:hypothetical protein
MASSDFNQFLCKSFPNSMKKSLELKKMIFFDLCELLVYCTVVYEEENDKVINKPRCYKYTQFLKGNFLQKNSFNSWNIPTTTIDGHEFRKGINFRRFRSHYGLVVSVLGEVKDSRPRGKEGYR